MTGWCVAEERCARWDRRNQVPAVADSVLCEDCLRAGGHAAAVLVLDYVDLEQHIAAGGGGGEHVSGTRDAPIPIALSVEALQREIWLLTTTWAEVLIDADRLAPVPPRVRDGFAVQHAVRIIRPRVRRLALLPCTTVMPHGPDGDPEEHSGAEGLLAMVRLHSRVQATLGLTRLVHEMPGECRACAMPTLRRDNGSDEVYCAACFARWGTAQEYSQYAGMVAAQYQAAKRRKGRGANATEPDSGSTSDPRRR